MTARSDREARLAQALRVNLRRRKAQARERGDPARDGEAREDGDRGDPAE